MQSVPLEPIEAEPAERRIERLYALPAAPAVVRELLSMESDAALEGRLEALLRSRPNLHRQLTACLHLLCACSRDEWDKGLETFDRYRMTLAIATARSFTYVCNGPLGAHAFWHHGLSNAVLCCRLAPDNLCRGTVFMSGLLHNIGFMVIACLFPPEFKMMNRLFASHADIPVTILERCVLGMGEAQELLGMGHAQSGSWLLQEWGMPPEAGIVAREHHNPDYHGAAAQYCQVVAAANRLLAVHALGDTFPDPLDPNRLPDRTGASGISGLAEKLASMPEVMATAVRELVSGPVHTGV